MKKIGLFGIIMGHEQKEMVKEAIALGYEPVLISHRDYPVPKETAGLLNTIIELNEDFESEAAVTSALTELRARDIELAGVFPIVEMGVILAGLVANRLSLPWNDEETVLMFRNKSVQRQRLAAAGIRNPRLWHVKTREELEMCAPEIVFPSVFKPVSGFGKVGVQKVNCLAELFAAFDSFAINQHEHFSLVNFGGGFLIEEFIQGDKITVELLIAGVNEILPLTITESTLVGTNFLEIAHAVPSALPDSEQNSIKAFGVKVIQALGVTRGVVHLELLRCQDGRLFVIEANGRCPGGRVTTLVREASNNNYIRMALQVAIEGRLPEILPFFRSAAVHWFCRTPGRLEKVEGFDKMNESQGFIQNFIGVKTGDKMVLMGDGTDRVGFSMNFAADTRTAKQRAEASAANVRLITVAV